MPVDQRNPQFDDCYFSNTHGLEESLHVFINGNSLPERIREGKLPDIGERRLRFRPQPSQPDPDHSGRISGQEDPALPKHRNVPSLPREDRRTPYPVSRNAGGELGGLSQAVDRLFPPLEARMEPGSLGFQGSRPGPLPSTTETPESGPPFPRMKTKG